MLRADYAFLGGVVAVMQLARSWERSSVNSVPSEAAGGFVLAKMVKGTPAAFTGYAMSRGDRHGSPGHHRSDPTHGPHQDPG